MKPSLQVRLSQHLALTPQLQQSIRLLQLSTLELHQEVAAGAGQASVLVVSLRSAVTVADPHVCLGDVASILGGDASLRRHLSQLDLADLSATNAVARITRQQVDFLIRLDGV